MWSGPLAGGIRDSRNNERIDPAADCLTAGPRSMTTPLVRPSIQGSTALPIVAARTVPVVALPLTGQ
jgi:hypothetical protein